MIGLNWKQMVASTSSWLDTVTFPVLLSCRFVLLICPHPLDSVHPNPHSKVSFLAADSFIHPPWCSLIIPVYVWLCLLRIQFSPSFHASFEIRSIDFGGWSFIEPLQYLLQWMGKWLFVLKSVFYLTANFHQIRVLVTGVDVPRPSAHQTFAFRFIIYKVWYTVMKDIYFQ